MSGTGVASVDCERLARMASLENLAQFCQSELSTTHAAQETGWPYNAARTVCQFKARAGQTHHDGCVEW